MIKSKRIISLFLLCAMFLSITKFDFASASFELLADAEIKLSASETGRIARNTQTQISLVDRNTGNEIDTSGASKIQYDVSPLSKATVDADGMLTALENGAAVLTMTVYYDGKSPVALSKNINIQDSGENLMAHLNTSFEEKINDSNWPWAKGSYNDITYIEPATPDTFYYTAVKTMGRDGNNNNKAFAVYMNPEITSAGSNILQLKFGSGGDPRLRLELPKNKLYEMSFYLKADSLDLPSGCTVSIIYDAYAYPTSGTTALLPVPTNRNGRVVLTEDLDWTKITVPVAAPTDSTGNYIYITPRILVQATAGKNEVSGCIYLDDIEIRQVGYEGIDVTWPDLSDENTSGTLLIQPLATTGSPISIGTAVFTDNITVTSSNAEVAEVPSSVTRQVFPSNSGIHRATSNITIKGSGETEITVSANVNGETKTNTKKIHISSYKLDSTTLVLESSIIYVNGSTIASAISRLEGGDEVEGVEYEFSSDNTGVATIDKKTGEIVGIAPGEASITVAATLGSATKYDTKKISVKEIPEYSNLKFEIAHRRDAFPDCYDRGNVILDEVFYEYGKYGRNWAYLAHTFTDTDNTFLLANYLRMYPLQNEYLALKINVPQAGGYTASLNYYGYHASCITGVYIVPMPESEIVNSFYIDSIISDSDNRLAQVDMYAPSTEAGMKSKVMNEIVFESEGDYLLIYRCEGKNDAMTYPTWQMLIRGVEFDGLVLSDIELALEADVIGVNEKIRSTVSGMLSDGTEAALESADVKYTTSDSGIAAVDQFTGEITGIATGEASITATVTYKGETKTNTKSILIDESGAVSHIEITSNPITSIGYNYLLTACATLKSNESIAIPIENLAFELISASPAGIAAVSADGKLNATGTGDVTVRAQATVRGLSFTSEDFVISIHEVGDVDLKIPLQFNKESGSAVNGRTIKNIRRYGWSYYADTVASTVLYNTNFMQIASYSPEEWVAYKINIPEAGNYLAAAGYFEYSAAGMTQYYLLPFSEQSVADITTQLKVIEPIGEYDGRGTASGAPNTSYLGEISIPYPGDYLLVIKSNAGRRIYQRSFTLSGKKAMHDINISVPGGDVIDLNTSTQINVQAIRLNSEVIESSKLNLLYRSLNPAIASVDENGMLTANYPGHVDIKVTATYKGSVCETEKQFYIVDTSEIANIRLNIPSEIYVNQELKLNTALEMSSGNNFTLQNTDVEYEITSCEPEGAVSLSGGILTCLAMGNATLRAKINYNGVTAYSDDLLLSIVKSQKEASTIFTDDYRAVIRENAVNYPWAAKEVDAAKKAADKYVNINETLWNLPVAEGLPRFFWMSSTNDPNKWICPYCKKDIQTKYAGYSWICNALTEPWKIKCPECRRAFPSNDFGSYYNLGINEFGVFNSDLAAVRNQELIDNGEDGYLVNVLYSEKGENWMVDDGFGYYTGTVYASGIKQRYNPIAYYLHNALWFCNSPRYGSQSIRDAIDTLTTAYVYTGESKYGRAGAILLDRIADLYPDFDYDRWMGFRDDIIRGKIITRGWSCQLVYLYAYAYDAFYPMYDDPYVIKFLSEKAEKYNMSNPKNSKEAIVRNLEDRLLREMYRDAVDYKTHGGFGYIQRGMIAAAIALDSSPETEEWLDWVMASEEETYPLLTPPRTGGDVMQYYINSTNNVDRDGNSEQGAPGYNISRLRNTIEMADPIFNSGKYEKYNLYNNPKIAKLYTAQMDYTLSDYYTPQIGDSGSVGIEGISSKTHIDTLIDAYYRIKHPTIAQIIHKVNGNSVNGLHYGITSENPDSLANEINEVINKYGEYELKSKNLTGYGMAILRNGNNYISAGSNQNKNNITNFGIYYGRNTGHGHRDTLSLFIDAFGLNMAPDLGYPEQTGNDPHRLQWVNQQLSHNTVQVNGRRGNAHVIHGTPIHFDDSGLVKIMDVEAPNTYAATDEYRRTVVMIEANDDTCYAVDFFRVRGGDRHIYSFHSQSKNISEEKGLNLIKQTDKDGNYKGTLAGIDVPLGPDPITNFDSGADYYLQYPTGFTWLYNIRRDINPTANIEVDFDVTDFRRILDNGNGLHLRLTMLSDGYELSDFIIASSVPPQNASNLNNEIDTLEYVLAQRTGNNLDTLFTTVFEPYRDTRYLRGSESVPIIPIDGEEADDDAARAVKVKFEDGREDYILYATNNKVTYRVADLFEFRGSVGVCTYKNNEIIYTYVNDGEIIANKTYPLNAYSGAVIDFTREISMTNQITISLNQDITDAEVDTLAEKYIYINNSNESPENGSYRILGAKRVGPNTLELDIGDVVLIRGLKDIKNLSEGYLYNIASGQAIRIPIANAWDQSPVFINSGDIHVDAKSQIQFKISAVSPAGRDLTYKAITLPRGASFNPVSQTFSWTPEINQLGDNHVAIEATDQLLSTTAHLMVRVFGGTMGDSASIPKPKQDGDSPSGATPPPHEQGVENPAQPAQPDTPPPTERFIDLVGFDWARSAIEELADADIIKGTGHNTYSPGANIKRGDFVLLMARAFELKGESLDGFSDVPADAYYKEAVAAANGIGIITGVGDNKFNPAAEISRQDIMAIVKRLLDYLEIELKPADDEALSAYTDSSEISDYAKDAASTLIANEIITGSNNRINPRGNATRAEIAVILMRVMEKAL